MTDDTGPAISRRNLLAMGGGALAAASLLHPTLLSAETTPMTTPAKITQIRNATLVVDYAGTKFLIDPMFADQGSAPGFQGSACSQFRNPLVPLPAPVADLVAVDAVIVTHLHGDHWDAAAQAALPKDKPLFAQNEEDAGIIRGQGFTDVRVLTEASEFNGIRLSKTGGQHGTDETLAVLPLGEVSGVVFSQTGHSTLYVAGDTIWNDHVKSAIGIHRPNAIVVNIGHAVFMGFDPIIMGIADAVEVNKAAPKAKLIASHMEAINHCILSRQTLRDLATVTGISDSLLIPEDGETVSV